MRPGIALRPDYDAAQLRALAKATRDAGQSRRLLALAEIYDGGSRNIWQTVCSLPAFIQSRSTRSPRAFTTAPFMLLASTAWRSGGSARQALPFIRLNKPSHMWFVIAQYFCTS